MLDQLGPRRESREILSGGRVCEGRGRDLGGGGMWPQAEECLEPPEARRGRKDPSLELSEGPLPR